MITLDDVDDLQLVRSLRMTVCPVCGKVKRPAQTFCYRDYRNLPREMQLALYNRLGEGYAEAVVKALNFLEVEEPAWPDEQRRAR